MTLDDKISDSFAKILQGASRKALNGNAPFKPLNETDTLVAEFAQDFREAAPLFGVDFDAVIEPVVLKEIEKR
jgi:hypothetical protein